MGLDSLCPRIFHLRCDFSLASGQHCQMPHQVGNESLRQDTWNGTFAHLQKFKGSDQREDHTGYQDCNVAFLNWRASSPRKILALQCKRPVIRHYR